jgi:integrase/recombinase XerD
LVCFLTREEIEALLAAPNRDTRIGRRDHALLLVAVQTGLRVSELTGLTCADLRLGAGRHLFCRGKNRKQRCVPLTAQTVAVLKTWLAERHGEAHDVLFPTNRGGHLSRDTVQWLITKHVAAAAHRCPSLATKHITPHVLRHTCAMNLRQAGVDVSVIALWLGHFSGVRTPSGCAPLSAG